MLGSLTFYRRMLNENVFHPSVTAASPFGLSKLSPSSDQTLHKLPAFGHGIAGIMAGWTVSVIAAPVEHIKARLQIQYAVDKRHRPYSGPVDCLKKIVRL